jgi:hypothetical protein
LLFRERAPSSISEEKETSNQELEDAGARQNLGGVENIELDDEGHLWDGLLIDDDDDEEVLYWSK